MYTYNQNHTDLKGVKLDGGKLSFAKRKFNVLDRSCTAKDKCCEGEGKTILMVNFTNCDQLKVMDVVCVDTTALCKCRAGFLNAGVFITLVGMLLCLVPCN